MTPVRAPGPDTGDSGLRFEILGSLRACDQGGPIEFGSPKQRLALSVLLCNANRLVSVDILVEALWDDSPPLAAKKNLQVHICALRRLMGVQLLSPRITHKVGGYILEVDEAQLDWLMFEQKLRDSQHLWRREQLRARARVLAEALQFWRGPVLDGMRDNSVVDAAAQRLEDRVVTTFEDWAEAEVATGGAAGAIEQITNLALRHPFRERLRIVQMTALSQLGRRTEALGIYDEVRRSLAAEFGLSPSTALTALYETLLREGEAARSIGQSPAQLPAFSTVPRDLANFTGRQIFTRQIVAALAGGERLAMVTGPVGIGKTTVAVHIAHQLRLRFPDGCFFASLRADDGRLLSPRQIISELWCAVMESGPAGRRGGSPELWQRWLATRTALLVFDDVRRESEVRPLLPRIGNSVTVVTSRARLTGLGMAFRIILPPLSVAEAMDLLSNIIGPERVDRDRGSAERIVKAAGLSPLGVRIIGDKLAALCHVPLHEYLGRVDAAPSVLDELTAGDLTVRARLAGAVEDLPAAVREAFTFLGRLPEPLFTLDEAAGLLRLEVADALRVLETLLEANVISVPPAEADARSVVYRMPVLAHAYARELCARLAAPHSHDLLS